MAIGNELRQSIVQAIQTQEVSQDRLARMLGVSYSSVKRIWQRYRQTGNAQLKPFAGGKRPKLTEEQNQQVRQFVRADTDATLREVQRWLEARHVIRLSLPALSRLLTKLELPRKKSRSMQLSGTRQQISRSGKPGATK